MLAAFAVGQASSAVLSCFVAAPCLHEAVKSSLSALLDTQHSGFRIRVKGLILFKDVSGLYSPSWIT